MNLPPNKNFLNDKSREEDWKPSNASLSASDSTGETISGRFVISITEQTITPLRTGKKRVSPPEAHTALDNTRLLLPRSNDAAFKPSRNERNERENAAREIERKEQKRLSMFKDRKIAGQILPEERVWGCGRIPVSMPGARIQVCGEKGKFFSGIMNCGSVWHCPVCAKKIGLHRAATVTEILRKFQSATAKGDKNFNLGFLTLTVRHSHGELLADVLKRVLKSFREIEQSRVFREEKKRINYFGCIRTVEVKHGGNGWHPHLHLLLVADCDDVTMENFASFFINEWLKRNPDANEIAQKFVPVKNDKGIAEYITKWNAASEMTMGSTAKLSGKSFTPFQFLSLWTRSKMLNRDRPDYPFFAQYKGLFIEYSQAMKGKKQLTIARDVIKQYESLTGQKFSMKTDDEINVEQQEEKAIVEIDRDLFKIIASRYLQAHVLNEIEFKGVKECVDMLIDYEIECEWDEERNIIQLPRPPEELVTFTSHDWKELENYEGPF